MEEDYKFKIRVSNGSESLQIVLPFEAILEDWIQAFKTILIYQTYSEDTVKNLFAEKIE